MFPRSNPRIAFVSFVVLGIFGLTACGGGGGGAAPTPLASVALPKTGQTACYDALDAIVACNTVGIPPGQDGALQIGVAEPAPRFAVGTGVGTTDQCVTDNLTGLMWVRAPSTTLVTWANALTNTNNLTLCGFSDWRLANRVELNSLISYGLSNNAATLNTVGFSNVQTGIYWSSSSSADVKAFAWCVRMLDGAVLYDFKPNGHYVWPVRAGL